MKRIAQLLSLKKNYDSLIAAIAAFFIIYTYTRHSGIGISPDSVVYLSTARNLHAQGLPLDFNNRHLVIFPLLYPFFLSACYFITTLDPMAFAPLLNAFLFAITIYTCGWMIERFNIHVRWYKEIMLSCLVLSPCILEIYSMMWSETIFLFLLLSFIILLSRYLRFPSIKNLVYVSCIVSLSCVTRYAGITLIGAGGLIIILAHQFTLRKKILYILIFSSVSSFLLVANFIHNHAHSSTLTGVREKSVTSFFNNIYYFGYVLCDWLPLPENSYSIAFLTAISLLTIFTVVLARRFIRKIHFNSYENISMVFFVVYGMFMILSATFSRYELFSSRLVSPAFIPMLFGGSSLIMQLIKNASSEKKRLWITVIVLIVFSAFQINQLKDDFENHDGIKDAGIPGYTEDPWNKDSELVNFLRKNAGYFQPGYSIYSNADDAVYFFTGLRCNNLPHNLSAGEKKEFLSEKKCYLIWFYDSNNTELLSLDEALRAKNMAILYQFSNGAIYITQ
jgi:hypothetical protein